MAGVGVRSFGMELQLTVDTAGGDLGELAYRWLDGVSTARAADARARVADLPARKGRGRYIEPGGDFTYLRVDRWRERRPPLHSERIPSRKGMAWLREELADVPRKVTLEFGHLDETGYMTGSMTVLAERHDVAPDRVVLTTYLYESELSDAAAQRFYLDLLWGFADEMNPAFGHIAYSGDGRTAFEAGLRNVDRVPPPEWWSYPRTLAGCREALRGYSWLTILPQDLLHTVGGLDALADCGAFVEVRPLSAGGVWLLATEDHRDFDDAALLRVFHALAPALRPGPVTLWPPVPERPPLRVVPKDASRLGETAVGDPTTPWWWTVTVENPAPPPVDITPAAPGEITDTVRWDGATWWIVLLMVEAVVPPGVDPTDLARVLAGIGGGLLQMRAEVGYTPDVPPEADDPHMTGSPHRAVPDRQTATYYVRLAVAFTRRPEPARIFTELDAAWKYACKRHYGQPGDQRPVFIPITADTYTAGHHAARFRTEVSG